MIWVIAALLLIAAPAIADDPVFAARAAAAVQSHLEAERFSGAVLVAVDGKAIFRQGFGFADRAQRIPNTPETRFRTGSIGKQFAAAATLQLAERGKLGLDDPISSHYDKSPAAWSKITLRHLLSMRSGIFNLTNLPDFDDRLRNEHSIDEVIGLTRDMPLRFEPGSRFEYSNSGYTVIGHVIENLSGQSYGAYLRDNVFTPLGMRNSGYEDEAAARTLAKGYVIEGGEWKIAPSISMSVVRAAGATYSTVDDLLKWEQALGSGKLLNPDSTQAMFTNYGNGYGFGWSMSERLGYRVQMHSGGIFGFHTILCRYPDDKVTIIVLANLTGAWVSWIANELASLYFGSIPVLPRLCLYES